jgi:uncharacterized membrane protein
MEEQKSNQVSPKPGSSDSNLMAALSYVWVLSVVMLVVKKDDEFVKFHAKQGTVLFLASIVAWFFSIFLFFLGPLICAVIAIGCIIGFIKALGGERYSLPVVGELANKIKL